MLFVVVETSSAHISPWSALCCHSPLLSPKRWLSMVTFLPSAHFPHFLPFWCSERTRPPAQLPHQSVPWLSTLPHVHAGDRHRALGQLPDQLFLCLYAPAHLCLAAHHVQAECRRTAQVWDHPVSPTEVPGMPAAAPRPLVSCQNHRVHPSGLGKQTPLWEDHRTGVMHKASLTYF